MLFKLLPIIKKMFEPVANSNQTLILNEFTDESKNNMHSSNYGLSSPGDLINRENFTYGLNLIKNTTSYAAEKIYEYEWKKSIKDVSENIFPRPKDPRLGFIVSHPKFEDRLKLSLNLRQQYPDSIPIILERDAFSHLMPLKKKKIIMPATYNLGELTFCIRNMIPNLNSYEGVIILVTQYDKHNKIVKNTVLTQNSMLLLEFFNSHKSEDNFLYFNIKEENVFG